jgi:hypothetical protein
VCIERDIKIIKINKIICTNGMTVGRSEANDSAIETAGGVLKETDHAVSLHSFKEVYPA